MKKLESRKTEVTKIMRNVNVTSRWEEKKRKSWLKDQMKKKYHTIGTLPKSNRKTHRKIDTPSTQIQRTLNIHNWDMGVTKYYKYVFHLCKRSPYMLQLSHSIWHFNSSFSSFLFPDTLMHHSCHASSTIIYR